MAKTKFKVGDVVKFIESCHNWKINNAIVRITKIESWHSEKWYYYEILKAANTDRKTWNTVGDNFVNEVKYYPLTKLEKVLYEE